MHAVSWQVYILIAYLKATLYSYEAVVLLAELAGVSVELARNCMSGVLKVKAVHLMHDQ